MWEQFSLLCCGSASGEQQWEGGALRPLKPAVDGASAMCHEFAILCCGKEQELEPHLLGVAPSGLFYPTLPAELLLGEYVKAEPVITGRVIQYRVEPFLPQGLELDIRSGEIRGTPEETAQEVVYTVTAANKFGSFPWQIRFAVVDPDEEEVDDLVSDISAFARERVISKISAVSKASRASKISVFRSVKTANWGWRMIVNLTYPNALAVYCVGEMVDIIPAYEGEAAATWFVAPSLPEGLELDEETGRIYGEPEAVTEERIYSVTAESGGGITMVNLVFGIDDFRPRELAYPDCVASLQAGGEEGVSWQPSCEGQPDHFSVIPGLPEGMLLDDDTGLIRGIPAEAAELTEYQVTAQNEYGECYATLKFEVLPAPQPPPEVTQPQTPPRLKPMRVKDANTFTNPTFRKAHEWFKQSLANIVPKTEMFRYAERALWEDPEVTEINFTNSPIPERAADPKGECMPRIMKSLAHNKHITRLVLPSTGLVVEDARLLAEALKTNTTLTYLDISSNGFGPEVLIELARAIGENEGTQLSNIHLTQQTTNLGFQCEKIWAELVQQKETIQFLDMPFQTPHWRDLHSNALTRNKNNVRKKRKQKMLQQKTAPLIQIVELRDLACLEILLVSPPEQPYGVFFQEVVSGQEAFRRCVRESKEDSPLPTAQALLTFGRSQGTMTWTNAQGIHKSAIKTTLNAALKTQIKAAGMTKDKRKFEVMGTLTRLDNGDKPNKILEVQGADGLSIVEFPSNTSIKISESWRHWFHGEDSP